MPYLMDHGSRYTVQTTLTPSEVYTLTASYSTSSETAVPPSGPRSSCLRLQIGAAGPYLSERRKEKTTSTKFISAASAKRTGIPSPFALTSLAYCHWKTCKKCRDRWTKVSTHKNFYAILQQRSRGHITRKSSKSLKATGLLISSISTIEIFLSKSALTLATLTARLFGSGRNARTGSQLLTTTKTKVSPSSTT